MCIWTEWLRRCSRTMILRTQRDWVTWWKWCREGGRKRDATSAERVVLNRGTVPLWSTKWLLGLVTHQAAWETHTELGLGCLWEITGGKALEAEKQWGTARREGMDAVILTLVKMGRRVLLKTAATGERGCSQPGSIRDACQQVGGRRSTDGR